MKRYATYRRYKQDKKGVAAVEFALIAPVLALLLIGIIDFGFYINAEMKVEAMARSAAEYVRNGGDPDNITDDILAFAVSSDGANSFEDNLRLETSTVCECDGGEVIDCSDSCAGGSGYKREFFIVNLDIDYAPLFPYPGLPDSIALNGHARIQTE